MNVYCEDESRFNDEEVSFNDSNESDESEDDIDALDRLDGVESVEVAESKAQLADRKQIAFAGIDTSDDNFGVTTSDLFLSVHGCKSARLNAAEKLEAATKAFLIGAIGDGYRNETKSWSTDRSSVGVISLDAEAFAGSSSCSVNSAGKSTAAHGVIAHVEEVRTFQKQRVARLRRDVGVMSVKAARENRSFEKEAKLLEQFEIARASNLGETIQKSSSKKRLTDEEKAAHAKQILAKQNELNARLALEKALMEAGRKVKTLFAAAGDNISSVEFSLMKEQCGFAEQSKNAFDTGMSAARKLMRNLFDGTPRQPTRLGQMVLSNDLDETTVAFWMQPENLAKLKALLPAGSKDQIDSHLMLLGEM